MNILGNGLGYAKHHEEALSVKEAELSMLRRLGKSEYDILATQGNIASTYDKLGRLEEALRMRQDVYSGFLKLEGEESFNTLREASNYAALLKRLNLSGETKSFLRKTIPVARRVLEECQILTLAMKKVYAEALYEDATASPDNLREAVTMLEETERTARRVLGGAHPLTMNIEGCLRNARAELRSSDTPSTGN